MRLGEPDDADAGAEALLRMATFAHDHFDKRCRAAPDLGGLPHQPFRCPVGVAPMAGRHVLAHRRMAAVG